MKTWAFLAAIAFSLMAGCMQSREAEIDTAPLAPMTVAGGYWIELSPVIVAANNFLPVEVTVAGGSS